MIQFLKLVFFCLIIHSMGFGQVIKGSITDENGASIPFAKVWIKNTSYGTISNGKGQYHLDVPAFCDEGGDAGIGKHPRESKTETPCQRRPQHPLCQPSEGNPDGHQVGHAGPNQEEEHKGD